MTGGDVRFAGPMACKGGGEVAAWSSLPILFFHGWCLSTLILWGFAFYEAPAATPEWLLRAQAACFGRTATGLPDASGWMLLILGPATMLLSFCIAFGSDLTSALRSLGSGSRTVLAVFGVVALLEGAWVARRIAAAQLIEAASFAPSEGAALPTDYPFQRELAPEFRLIDQHGEPISLSRFRGRVVLLGFAFAHCQTVCPVLVRTLREAHRALGTTDVSLVLVTLDPRRDTASSLSGLAERYELGPDQYLLSGSVEDVEAVATAYGVAAVRDPQTGDILHPPLVYVLGAGGERGYALLNPPTSWVVDAARRIHAIVRSTDE